MHSDDNLSDELMYYVSILIRMEGADQDMKIWTKVATASLALTLAVSGVVLTQPAYAAQATKTLQAVYNNIQIVYNGTQVATEGELEPFLINGTTYLPLRAVGSALDKKVTWDGTNKRVVIEDTSLAVDETTITALNSQINTLQQELTASQALVQEKDASIATLNSQIASLQSQLNSSSSSSSSSMTVAKLEDQLNDDYEDYQSTDSVIDLSGDEDDLYLEITVDRDGWSDLSSSQQRSYVQDIVDDILDEYEDADISGEVYDSTRLATINVSSSGTVSLGNTTVSLSELRDDLNDDYGTYNDVNFNIYLSGDEDDVTVEVYVYEDDWTSLSSSRRSSFVDNLIGDIEDAYPNAYISGYIYDEDDSSTIERFNN